MCVDTDHWQPKSDEKTRNLSLKFLMRALIETFRQLHIAFASWAGEKWHPTRKQTGALASEAEKRIIPAPSGLKGFSSKYDYYSKWATAKPRTRAYQRRVINYSRKHPNASLPQARGHSKNVKRS